MSRPLNLYADVAAAEMQRCELRILPLHCCLQIGNKVWYGGVGAKDLIGRTCVDLPRKLTVSKLEQYNWVGACMYSSARMNLHVLITATLGATLWTSFFQIWDQRTKTPRYR